MGLFYFTQVSAQSKEYKIYQIGKDTVLMSLGTGVQHLDSFKVDEGIADHCSDSLMIEAWKNEEAISENYSTYTYTKWGTERNQILYTAFLKKQNIGTPTKPMYKLIETPLQQKVLKSEYAIDILVFWILAILGGFFFKAHSKNLKVQNIISMNTVFMFIGLASFTALMGSSTLTSTLTLRRGNENYHWIIALVISYCVFSVLGMVYKTGSKSVFPICVSGIPMGWFLAIGIGGGFWKPVIISLGGFALGVCMHFIYLKYKKLLFFNKALGTPPVIL